jgi:predicted Fe-Mo cluster-binding NifX family protein
MLANVAFAGMCAEHLSTRRIEMKIAVTSQNRKTITGHAGKCRKFWVYEVEDNSVRDKHLLELPLSQSFHECDHDALHPLDGVKLLITGGLGLGLQHRLEHKGIVALATAETDPDNAVAAWLSGSLIEQPPDAHDGHEYGQGHGQGNGHGQGHGQSPQVIAVVDLKAHA